MKLAVVFGTRPEAIKLAPLISALQNTDNLQPYVVNSGQHPDLTKSILDLFEIESNMTLNIFSHGQTLNSIIAKILTNLEPIFLEENPNLVIVQGDTSTSMATALVAFNLGIPVAHVEAGLRTSNKLSPFPEELNRRIITQIADLHFPATENAKENLISENVQSNSIYVVGNTVIDAALKISQLLDQGSIMSDLMPTMAEEPFIFVTLHRRESWGKPLDEICRALRDLSDRFELRILLPMHPNPKVRAQLKKTLGEAKRIDLVEPLSYVDTIAALKTCLFVATDSGGLQEEAPSFGKPVVVLRNETERIEGIQAGCSVVAGTSYESVFETISELLMNLTKFDQMRSSSSPYGDGKSSIRITAAIEAFLSREAQRRPGD